MKYKAVDARGRMQTGQIDAVNSADLEMRLERLGLDLVNFKETAVQGAIGTSARVNRRDLINFCFQFEQLINAGVPIVDALGDLRDSTEDKKLREIIAGLVESIEGGKSMSQSMEAYPQVFDTVFTNLLRAGEASGQVGEVLKQISESLKWQDEQAAQIKKLVMYPIFVSVVVVLVLAALMTFLVPQLVSLIKSMGQELPWHTKALIATSNFFVNYWYLLFIAPVLIFVIFATVTKSSPALRFAMGKFKLRVWVLGPIMKKVILARFATYFAMMYASGITVLECLRISELLVGNVAVADAVNRAGRQIAEGASISSGFEATGLFPPLVIRMLKVGETTGGLDRALLNIAYFYNRDVEEAMGKMQEMIMPVLTVMIGSVLIWVIISVYGPIYELITQLG